MAETQDISVLRRMAGAQRVKVGPTAMTLDKALRTALVRAADEVLKIAVGVREFEQETHLPEDLTDHLPDSGLFLMLRAPGGGVGVAVLCPQCLGAVIEAATMGQVLKREAAERRATGTDAALTRAWLDPALANLGGLAAECSPLPPVDGYTCDTLLGDGRAAQMVLADAAHLRLTVEVEFGFGAKIGKMSLIVPMERPTVVPDQNNDGQWAATLNKSVLATHAALEAVLCELSLPLSDITKFEVGQLLPLSNASIDDVGMIGRDGNTVISARLGRSGNARAVRLRSPANGAAPVPRTDPEFEPGSELLSGAPTLPGPMALPQQPSDDLPMDAIEPLNGLVEDREQADVVEALDAGESVPLQA